MVTQGAKWTTTVAWEIVVDKIALYVSEKTRSKMILLLRFFFYEVDSRIESVKPRLKLITDGRKNSNGLNRAWFLNWRDSKLFYLDT